MQNELAAKKMVMLQDSLQKLEELLPETFDAYKDSVNTQLILERLFQLVVDSAVDINNALLEQRGKSKADTYFGTFTAMDDAKLLPVGFAARIASSVGLRNALIHRYETLDHARAYEGMKKFAKLYREYLIIIERLS